MDGPAQRLMSETTSQHLRSVFQLQDKQQTGRQVKTHCSSSRKKAHLGGGLEQEGRENLEEVEDVAEDRGSEEHLGVRGNTSASSER